MPDDGKRWKVVLKPEGDRNAVNEDEKNEGGIVVQLLDTAGNYRQEVSRVGYARRHSRNPDVPFDDQLKTEWDKAKVACDLLNEQLLNAEGALL